MLSPHMLVVVVHSLLVTGLGLVSIDEAARFPAHCSTDVRAETIQPTGTPILLRITATNQSDAPVICDAGVPYQEAGVFQATITDAHGKVRELFLCKGMLSGGSRKFRRLEPGASLDVPGWIEPMHAGSYTIQVGQGKSAKFTISDDSEVAHKWDEGLLRKVRTGDPFAANVAYVCLRDRYARRFFINGLVRDLSSDNEIEVEHAAKILNRCAQ